MLIQCYECGKQISDKAECCPSCGCPIDKVLQNSCNINGVKYNLTDVIDILPKVGDRDTDVHPLHIMGIIRDRTSLDPDSSEKLANIIIKNKSIPTEFNGEVSPKITQSPNTPKCPICSSPNIKKIGAVERTASVVGLGLLSKKINKTFKCRSCGYTF